MRRLRRGPVDDVGASLILVLAFMTFLGLVVSALLTYSGTSLRSTNATQAKAESTYDIDGALQAAINKIRTDDPPFSNDPDDPPCPKLDFPGPNTKAPLTVTCVGGEGTGAIGGAVEINSNNRPRNALLTLGTGGEIGIDKGADNVLRVKGDVYVNSTPTSIDQSGSDCPANPQPPSPDDSCSEVWVDKGTVIARGSCDGKIVATATSCDNPAPNPAGADPSYPQPAGPLESKAVPPCGAAATVTFEPGYYDDAVALSNLTNGGCKNKVKHFKPGTYYFDFHNGEGPALPDGDHVWSISDATTDVVGGKPKGWTPAGGNPTIPGACVSPLDAAANGGVQFVFGGDSRIEVTAGNVELCGRYSVSEPPIVLYGARTGPDVKPALTAKTDGTGTSTGTGPEFASPENITEHDDVPSTAVIDGTAGEVTSEVTVKGFVPPTLPPGSILTKAELVVRHRSDSTSGAIPKALQVNYSSTRPGAADNSVALTPAAGPVPGEYEEDRLDALAVLAGEVHQYGLNGLRVKYAATVDSGEVAESIDSIQLELTWKPPAVRGEQVPLDGVANCIGAVGGCDLISTSGNETKFYLQGTTYAPLAKLDLKLTNASAEAFSVGLILRALKVDLTASVELGADAMIGVPDDVAAGVPKPLEVYFRAYICPTGVTCGDAAPAAPWQLAGTAQARFTDPDLFSPTPPYDTVTVLSWAVRRT